MHETHTVANLELLQGGCELLFDVVDAIVRWIIACLHFHFKITEATRRASY